jgi:MoaA/NifB/PqqE/SkfB family radical SAM enzyme
VAEILKNIAKTRKKSDTIVLTGGEPTTMPDIMDIARFCKKMKFRNIEMITNGRMLKDRRFAEKLVRAGVNGFAVSLYSFENKIHDRLTRVDGSAEETKEGIRTLLWLAKKYPISVRVNTVLAKNNYRTVLKTIKTLFKMGVRDFIVAEEIVISRKLPHLSLTDLKNFLKKITEMHLGGANICLRGFAPCLVAKKMNFDGRGFVLSEKDPSIILEKQEIDTLVKNNKDKEAYFSAFRGSFTKIKACLRCSAVNNCPGLQKVYVKKHEKHAR